MTGLNDEDAKELAKRRSYDEFKDHLNRYLVDCGASEGQAKLIGRHLVWWASVLAKTHGWFTFAVAAASVVALLAVLATFNFRNLLRFE